MLFNCMCACQVCCVADLYHGSSHLRIPVMQWLPGGRLQAWHHQCVWPMVLEFCLSCCWLGGGVHAPGPLPASCSSLALREAGFLSSSPYLLLTQK